MTFHALTNRADTSLLCFLVIFFSRDTNVEISSSNTMYTISVSIVYANARTVSKSVAHALRHTCACSRPTVVASYNLLFMYIYRYYNIHTKPLIHTRVCRVHTMNAYYYIIILHFKDSNMCMNTAAKRQNARVVGS